MNQNFRLIIGLGNPDKKYENTYHNVGFLFVDYLDEREKKEGWIKKPFAIRSKSYMNESGRFVALELKRTDTDPEHLLVAQDDSDIELGKYKLSFGRGAAGHHGIESIIASLKTKDFWRLRIGIRPAKEKIRQKSEKFVLKKITAGDKKTLENTFGQIAKNLNRV